MGLRRCSFPLCGEVPKDVPPRLLHGGASLVLSTWCRSFHSRSTTLIEWGCVAFPFPPCAEVLKSWHPCLLNGGASFFLSTLCRSVQSRSTTPFEWGCVAFPFHVVPKCPKSCHHAFLMEVRRVSFPLCAEVSTVAPPRLLNGGASLLLFHLVSPCAEVLKSLHPRF